MNIVFFSLILVIASAGEPPANLAHHNAQRAKELALSADTVVLRGELQPASKGVVVKDKKWIDAFAEALSHTHLAKSDQVLAVGWETAYFYRDGEQVLSVAPFEGPSAISPSTEIYILRAYSKKGGADFIVSEQECKAIENLIKEEIKTNHQGNGGR